MFGFLNLPKQTVVGNKIDKKLFYDRADLSTKERKHLKDDVERITWFNRIAFDTVNIRPFCDDSVDYTEIQVIGIEMRAESNANIIADVLFSSFPYPLILVFTHDDSISIHVAHVRINQNDRSRLVIEEPVRTGWILKDHELLSTLDIGVSTAADLRTLYSEFVDAVTNLKVSIVAGTQVRLSAEESAEVLQRIKELDTQITSLMNRLRKEDHFNRQVELNTQIKALQRERNQLIEKVKSDE